MKVKIFNISTVIQYVDLVGNENADDTIVLGPKMGAVEVDLSETRFLELSKEFARKLSLRKL